MTVSDAANPFTEPHDLDYRVGLDAKILLTSNLTLSATINPDFGQVELDPAVLNLSVFETFFPEKRPFFLEDSRALAPAFGRFPMFHSRRRPDSRCTFNARV